MSRPFRPRPLDIHKKLPIVKSVKDLDNDEVSVVSRTILHGHTLGNSDIEPAQPTATTRRNGEIPTPQFVVVESYEKDYSRTFVQPSSYVRGRGSRTEVGEFVEYDLDDEDEDWLQQFNNEKKLLPPESFEWMLYKLELLDHKARERAGGMLTTLGAPVPVLLQQEAALEALRCQDFKPTVLSAVYDYWRTKREQWQKPILRCLQPPPPANDTNPFNVFRPREKIHRPHTRRMQRRENDVQSFEKLRQVRRNLDQARTLLRMLQKREEKKREWLDCEANLQRMQITFKHDSMLDDEVVLGASSAMLTPASRKTVPFKRDDGHGTLNRLNSSVNTPDLVNGHMHLHPTRELTPPSSDGVVLLDHGDHPMRKGKRRRIHQSRVRPSKRIAGLDSLEPVLLFTKPLDTERLTAAGIVPPLDPVRANGLTQVSSPYCFQGRIGRGGRIIFDRWNPLTRTPVGSNIPVFPRSTTTRFHPPPPRLNLEKVNLVVSDPATADGNLTLNENQTMRTS